MSTSQLVNTSWSPSKTEHIAGRRDAANASSHSLWPNVTTRLANIPDKYHPKVIRLTGELENLLRGLEVEGKAIRIAELEAELEQVNNEGELAEAGLLTAKNEELRTRNAEAKRQARYDNATRNLNNVLSEPLPTFHKDSHVARKKQRIADARAEVDAAREDMENNGYAIPQIVQLKMSAEQRLNTLAASARAINKELSVLKGEDTHNNTDQQRGNFGLAG